MGRFYDTTPLKVWDLLGRGGRNIVRIEAEDDLKETVHYTHNRALTHKKFQQLQQYANVLWKRYPDKSPACKKWGSNELSAPAEQEVLAFDCCLEGKSQFSIVIWYLIYKVHSMAGPIPQSSWPTQTGLGTHQETKETENVTLGGWRGRRGSGRKMNMIKI